MAMPGPGPVQPGAMLPPAALSEKPSFTMNTVRFSASDWIWLRTPADFPEGGVVSMLEVKVTATVASTKIRMFTMISRNGTILSSPPSSSGASSRGWLIRRILPRCATVSWSDIAVSLRESARALTDGEQVERALHRRFEIVLNRLGARVQDDVRDHAEHRDAEAERGVVHGFRDAVRQQALLVGLREPCLRDGAERRDETAHRAEQPDQGRDVGE